MALLRQCLQELRVKRQEWTPSDEGWSDSLPRRIDDARAKLHLEARPASRTHDVQAEAAGSWPGRLQAAQ